MKEFIFTLFFVHIALNIHTQNNCLHFDGFNDFAINNDFSLGNNFTVSFWFKPSANPNFGEDDRILSFGPSLQLEIGVSDFVCDDGNVWYFDQSAVDAAVCLEADLRDGGWHHIAYRNFGVLRSIFLDGQLLDEYIGPENTVFSSKFRMGQSSLNGLTTHYSGCLDEVRIWDHTRSPDEIVEHMYCELVGNEEGLRAYWDFNQGEAEGNNSSIDFILDRTSNQFDLNLTNFLLLGSTSNFVESGAPLEGTCMLNSTNDNHAETLNIYPNPSKRIFNVEHQGLINAELLLHSMNGMLLIKKKFTSPMQIDLSDEPNGVYLLQLISENGVVNERLVKR